MLSETSHGHAGRHRCDALKGAVPVNFLRTTSTRRLIAGTALSAALVVGGVAAATAAGGGGTPPPAKPLDAAIHDSPRGAQARAAITARVHFTNNLIASGALPLGSPLLTGASGRLWALGRRRAPRAAVRRGRRADQRRRRAHLGLRRLQQHGLPRHLPATKDPAHAGTRHTACRRTAKIASALAQLAQDATISGAEPTTQAGQAAYEVSVSPKHDAGLLGQARDRLGRGATACRCASRSPPPAAARRCSRSR